MSALPPPPLKTELGQDELRRRTRKLSQRHRTVLLLVDGRRSREQVIDLAAQAGVMPSVYGDLIELGLIEAPAVPAVAIAEPLQAEVEATLAPPVAEAAPALVAAEDFADAPRAMPPPTAAPVLETVVPEPVTAIAAASPAVAAPSSDAGPDLPVSAPAAFGNTEPGSLGPARVKFSTPIYRRPVAATAPPVLVSTVARAPSVRAPAARRSAVTGTARDDGDAALFAEVRGLLIGSLLLDGPVSGSMLALRVRRAQGRTELTRLVWQIERDLVHARIPREGQWRLIKARELLGLGNTVVVDDTDPVRYDDDLPPLP